MASSVATVAYEESKRAIQQQQGSLDGLRSRAGTLLSAASLVTSFFGAATVLDAHDRWSGVVAVVLFIGVLGASLYALWPREWLFSVSARAILDNQRRAPQSVSVVEASLAIRLEDHYDENQRKLNTLIRAFRYGCGALGVEIVAWLVPY